MTEIRHISPIFRRSFALLTPEACQVRGKGSHQAVRSGTSVALGEGMRSWIDQDRLQTPRSSVHVRIAGPGTEPLSEEELEILFREHKLTGTRRRRLRACPRILAIRAARTVGMLAYEQTDTGLRVREFAVDAIDVNDVDTIAVALLDALELACLAGGAKRIVAIPRTVTNTALLRNHGYVAVSGGSPDALMEKTFQ